MLSLVDKNPLMENSAGKVEANSHNQESVELLGLSSSDSLDSPSFTHFQAPKQKRKVRFKKQLRSNSARSKSLRSPPTKTCKCGVWPCVKILTYFAAIAIIGALLWYVMTLSTRIQELQAKFSDIEAGSRNTPEALHVIHSNLKSVNSNVSVLAARVRENIAQIDNITAEVKLLNDVANNLKASIAAAPAIQQLPKDILSLSEQIANFGSKLNALESNVKELKDQQSNLQTTAQSLSGELDTVKVTVQELVNTTDLSSRSSVKETNLQRIEETSQKVGDLQEHLKKIEKTLDSVNSTVMIQLGAYSELPKRVETVQNAVLFVDNNTQNLLASIENFIHSNLSLRVDQLESGRAVQKPMVQSEDLNKTVSEVILGLINTGVFHQQVQSNNSLRPIEQTHDLLVLLAALLEKYEHIPPAFILSGKNATELVDAMLQHAFEGFISPRNIKIENIYKDMQNLNSLCTRNCQTQGSHLNSGTTSSTPTLQFGKEIKAPK